MKPTEGLTITRQTIRVEETDRDEIIPVIGPTKGTGEVKITRTERRPFRRLEEEDEITPQVATPKAKRHRSEERPPGRHQFEERPPARSELEEEDSLDGVPPPPLTTARVRKDQTERRSAGRLDTGNLMAGSSRQNDEATATKEGGGLEVMIMMQRNHQELKEKYEVSSLNEAT